MFTVKKARLRDAISISEITNNFDRGMNYYSNFNGSILHSILTKTCYMVYKNNALQCILFIRRTSSDVFAIPANKAFSFFKLLYVLKLHFSLRGYKLSIKYNKLNLLAYKKYFEISIKENLRYMKLPVCEYEDNIETVDGLNIRQMVLKKDESIRVELQNEIFSHVHGRKNITVDEVIKEESSMKFLKNLCFILEYFEKPAGYGQILRIDSSFFLVNFGIKPEYQEKGFGYYFLHQIIKHCKSVGIKELYLTVDANNIKAINLYNKIGFTYVYGLGTIIL